MTVYAALFLGFVLGLVASRIGVSFHRDKDLTRIDMFRRLYRSKDK